MKKLLLTLATVAMALTANATEKVVFDITTAASDNWTGDGNGWTLTKDGFTITSEKGDGTTNLIAPNANTYSWRVYKGSKFTITSNEDFTMKAVVITYDNMDNNKYCKNLVLSDGWAGELSGDVFNSKLEAGSKTFTAQAKDAQVRIKKIEVSDDANFSGTGDTPNPPVTGDITVKKATAFEVGEVAFVFNEGFVETFAENANYGYWMAVTATPADEMKVTKEAIFTIASTDKGYTIKDCYDRFMGWDGQHWSVNGYSSSDEGHCYWDATMVDGKVKISNKEKNGDAEVYLCGKTYKNDFEMCPTDRENGILPTLYVKTAQSGVADVVVEENAPAVYYNLQGVRVENPENGLYIVVKGGKSQKVVF